MICHEAFQCIVMLYILFGLIAIGMSMYAFYAFRKRGREAVELRRRELKEVRREWLDHQLGLKTSDIILYGEFMDQKIARLKSLGTNAKRRETYYIDEESGEKWVKEYSASEMPSSGSAQLRKVFEFPFE